MTIKPPHLLIASHLMTLSEVIKNGFSDVHLAAGRLIFRDEMTLALKGTGLRAVILTSGPGGTANQPSSAFSQTVNVRCYADHTRVAGIAATEDGSDRAWAAWGLLDKTIHTQRVLMFPDPYVLVDRQGPPLPTYDQQLDLPYVSANYDCAILATA